MLIAAVKIRDDETGTAAVVLAVFLGLAFLLSPRAFPPSLTAARARELSAVDGRPVVYWRPGCQYCLRLRARLGPDAARLHWVDIWLDPEGAAAVREITGGDETVPTVVLAGQGFVNPDPSWLRDQLQPT